MDATTPLNAPCPPSPKTNPQLTANETSHKTSSQPSHAGHIQKHFIPQLTILALRSVDCPLAGPRGRGCLRDEGGLHAGRNGGNPARARPAPLMRWPLAQARKRTPVKNHWPAGQKIKCALLARGLLARLEGVSVRVRVCVCVCACVCVNACEWVRGCG